MESEVQTKSGYTEEFIQEVLYFDGFDKVMEKEFEMINKMIVENKQKSLNKKLKKVKDNDELRAELVREDVDDLEVLGIDAEILLIETLNEELDAAVREENTRLKRDILNKKINKVKNVPDLKMRSLFDDAPPMQSIRTYEDGQPCSINCERHRSYPCEKCGSIESKGIGTLPLNELGEKRLKLRLKLWKIKQ